jgi:acetate---CoA ligase (ADP-forming)
VERDGTIEAIKRILNAQSVAIVGASSDPAKFGFMTLDSLIRGGYEGQIFPINPKGGNILGQKVYKSYSDLPCVPELAVVIVPAKNVPEVLREISKKGTRGSVILTSGFKEIGRADLEAEIFDISQASGLRIVGPNVQGINYLPNKLCAMFFPVITKRGPLAIVTQSGSATAALAEWAEGEGLGVSAAINLGNQVDLCESDYIEFFSKDEHTRALALYIEGVKDGSRFLSVVSRTSRLKPIVILKSGRSIVGQRAVSSHTGSMAGNHKVFASACEQLGVVTADNIEHLYDCAKALATLKAPKGNRVLSIATSGGMGALAADEAENQGLTMPPLSKEFIEGLRELNISPFLNMSNPLDLGYVPSEEFRKVALLADQHNIADVVLLNIGDPLPGIGEVANFLNSNLNSSVAVSYLGGGEEEKKGRVEMLENQIPVFNSPERAMRGIGAAVRYAKYQARPKTFAPEFMERREPVDSTNSRILEPEGASLLRQYGITYPNCEVCKDADSAVEIAERIGYPVVLKIVSKDILHKSDVGGVIGNVIAAEGVRSSFAKIRESVQLRAPRAEFGGILVCKEASEGLDVIIGATIDPGIGPVLMFGMGGIFAEIIDDVSFRVPPLQREDAEEMIREIRGYPILSGARGKSGYDLDALIEVIVSLSGMLSRRTDIVELDLNPVRVFHRGAMALDVRIVTRNSNSR